MPHPSPVVKEMSSLSSITLACENIRFSSLFVAWNVSRGGTDVFAG